MKLIHPIYLDVPMMVSFAAAIEGGIAFDSEVTKSDEKRSGSAASVKAKFGLSALFESIFDAGVEGEAESNKEESARNTRKELRSHTEASVAIMLYDRLNREKGLLVRPESLEELTKMEEGVLVEFSGHLEKNAIDSIVDTIDSIIIMTSMGGGKNEAKKNLSGIRKALHEDRSRTPLSNVILNCDSPDELTAVVTLRTENLRDLTMSELHRNRVRIVGKVTRSIPEGETMSPFENYGLSIMIPESLSGILAGMEETDEVRLDLGSVEVQGPAVQILPLMVFV